MTKDKKRSRCRSRSRSHYKRSRREGKLGELQKRLDNLTKVVETLVTIQGGQARHKTILTLEFSHIEAADIDEKENEPPKMDDNHVQVVDEVEISDQAPEQEANNKALKVLGADPSDCKLKKIRFHPELKNTRIKWKKESLHEKNKTEILESYDRKEELFMKALELNEKVLPLCNEIPKQRDDNFVKTQNCVGTAIIALGAAITLLLEQPEDGVDEEELTEYISHADQMMVNVFHQQPVGRKAYITPKLGDDLKDMVDRLIFDKLFYGDKLKEKINSVTEIRKVYDNIKKKAAQK